MTIQTQQTNAQKGAAAPAAGPPDAPSDSTPEESYEAREEKAAHQMVKKSVVGPDGQVHDYYTLPDSGPIEVGYGAV